MAAPYAGFDCVLTVGGSTVVGKAQNVELTGSAAEIDVTTRSSDGWKEFIQGLKEWGASIDQLWVPTDTGLQALRDAWLTGDELAATFLDPDGNGFSGQIIVTGLNKGEPLDGAAVLPVTIKGTGPLSVVGVGS